jgi:plastocyanin
MEKSMLRLFLALPIVLLFAISGCSAGPTALPAPTSAPVATAVSKPITIAAPVSTTAPTLTAKSIQVEAWDDYFRPEKITVTVGAKVTWINLGAKKHNVAYGNLFDQDFNPGESVSYTFDKPGVYQYYCVQHSLSETEGMVGTITVVAP